MKPEPIFDIVREDSTPESKYVIRSRDMRSFDTHDEAEEAAHVAALTYARDAKR